MRLLLILLTTSACSQIFGIDSPERIDAAVQDPIDAPADSPPPTPDALVTVTFQEGMNGYASTRDTYIDAGAPNATRNNDSIIRVRTSDRWGLLAFAAIFGTARIPPTATITNATLQVAFGQVNCMGSIAEVNVDWTEAVTYNTFGADPGVQTDDFGALTGTFPASPGIATFDVLDSMKKWQAGTLANNGWIFVGTGGTTDCAITSADGFMEHPKLIVTFAP